MTEALRHLIFYDGECGLCDTVVQFLLRFDAKEQFAFAPLQGQTAKQTLPLNCRAANSVVLAENYFTGQPRFYVRSQAAFRICWLLGKAWKLLGGLFFLPPQLFDWAYNLVARYRYRLFAQRCLVPKSSQKRRFLP